MSKKKEVKPIRMLGIELENGNTVHIGEEFIDGYIAIQFYNKKEDAITEFTLSKDAFSALSSLMLKKALF